MGPAPGGGWPPAGAGGRRRVAPGLPDPSGTSVAMRGGAGRPSSWALDWPVRRAAWGPCRRWLRCRLGPPLSPYPGRAVAGRRQRAHLEARFAWGAGPRPDLHPAGGSSSLAGSSFVVPTVGHLGATRPRAGQGHWPGCGAYWGDDSRGVVTPSLTSSEWPTAVRPGPPPGRRRCCATGGTGRPGAPYRGPSAAALRWRLVSRKEVGPRAHRKLRPEADPRRGPARPVPVLEGRRQPTAVRPTGGCAAGLRRSPGVPGWSSGALRLPPSIRDPPSHRRPPAPCPLPELPAGPLRRPASHDVRYVVGSSTRGAPGGLPRPRPGGAPARLQVKVGALRRLPLRALDLSRPETAPHERIVGLVEELLQAVAAGASRTVDRLDRALGRRSSSTSDPGRRAGVEMFSGFAPA